MLVQDAKSATHIIIGDKHEGLQGKAVPRVNYVVASEWLEDCLSQQKRLPEGEYAADPNELAKEAESEGLAISHACSSCPGCIADGHNCSRQFWQQFDV